MGAMTWSYQPSESSQLIITAVLLQLGSFSKRVDRVDEEGLLVERVGVAGCPSWYLGAFRKLTAGKFPAFAGPPRNG